MSISSEVRRAGPYSGNGSTVAFPFTFKVFTTAQVVVTRTVAGVETVLALTTNYTVSLNADQNANPGGTVTMLTAPPVGHSITITSNVANLQPVALANLGGFYPEILNDGLDRATIQIQQLDERVDRALVVPVSSSGVSTQLPVPSSNALIGWNGSGTALQNYSSVPIGGTIYQYVHRTIATAGQTAVVLPVAYTLGTNALSVFVNGLRVEQGAGLDYLETNTTTITFTSGLANGDLVVVGIQTDVDAAATPPNYTLDNIAALRLLNSSSTANHLILLRNYVMGDGGGVFRYDSTDTTTADNGGTIIVDAASRRWKRQWSGAVDARWFGVRADGSTNDAAALQAAIDLVSTGGVVMLPRGTISYGTTLTVYGAVTLQGQGRGETTLSYTGAAQGIVQSTPSTRIYDVVIRDLTLSDAGTGTIGLDMASVSSGVFENLLIDGFTTGVSITGSNGFCVYNRFINVTAANATTGFIVGAAGSNSNTFSACRANVCTTGWNITDSNQNQLIGCQIESGTTGVSITSSSNGLADRNTIIACRFEGNTTNVNVTSSNVRETALIGNHHVTGTNTDSGTRTQRLDMFGTTGPNFKITSANTAVATGSFEFERTVNGGSSLPAMVVRDSNTGSGTPITVQAETERSTGSFFRGQRGGATYFEAYANGALAIRDGITAPSTVTDMAVIYVDTADGDLKVKFSDGTVKTIVTDT
jgi:hypothetical protein